MVRKSCWVFAMCSSCNRLHSRFAWAKSGHVSNVELSQLLSRRMNDSPKQFCQIAFFLARSTQWVTTNFCSRSRCSIVQVWMNGFILCRSEGPCLAPWLLIILLSNIARDWRDVVVFLFELFWSLRRLQNFFHNCNRQCRFPSRNCNRGVAFWKSFRKARRSWCCSCRRSNPAILCWTCLSSATSRSPEGRILVQVAL